MRFNLSALCVCATAALGFTAPALSAPAGDDPRLGEQVDRICTGRSLTGFSDATETSVVVETAGDRFYLIETTGRCFALDNARSLGFEQFSTCVRTGDGLVPARRSPFVTAHAPRPAQAHALRPTRAVGPCQIEAIYEWVPHADSAASAPSGR